MRAVEVTKGVRRRRGGGADVSASLRWARRKRRGAAALAHRLWNWAPPTKGGLTHLLFIIAVLDWDGRNGKAGGRRGRKGWASGISEG